MIANVILHRKFEPGFVFGKNFKGIVEHIQVPAKGAKFGLGYVPTDYEAEMKSKKVEKPLDSRFFICTNHSQFENTPAMMTLRKDFGTFLKKLMRSRFLKSAMPSRGRNCRIGPPSHFLSPVHLGTNDIHLCFFGNRG